jgi:hypothetical protein
MPIHCCGNPIHDVAANLPNLPALMPIVVLVVAWLRAKVRG